MKVKVKFDRLDEFGKAMTELNEAYERLMQAANRIRTEFPEIGLEIGNSTADDNSAAEG